MSTIYIYSRSQFIVNIITQLLKFVIARRRDEYMSAIDYEGEWVGE